MINPEDQSGRIESHGDGMGEVSDLMIQQRAKDLAIQEGRDTVREYDLTRARQELLGEFETAAADEAVEGVTAERLPPDEPAGSSGYMTERVSIVDEESTDERLVQEGLEEAEHELMTEAEMEQRRRNV